VKSIAPELAAEFEPPDYLGDLRKVTDRA